MSTLWNFVSVLNINEYIVKSEKSVQNVKEYIASPKSLSVDLWICFGMRMFNENQGELR